MDADERWQVLRLHVEDQVPIAALAATPASAHALSNGVSEQVKYVGDPPIAFYTITHFWEQERGESRYRKELARSGDLALAVVQAIDNLEVVAAKHGI